MTARQWWWWLGGGNNIGGEAAHGCSGNGDSMVERQGKGRGLDEYEVEREVTRIGGLGGSSVSRSRWRVVAGFEDDEDDGVPTIFGECGREHLLECGSANSMVVEARAERFRG